MYSKAKWAGGEPAPCTNLFIGNLPLEITEQELEAAFSPCGTIVSSKVVRHPETGQSKGAGFVKFATLEEAERAIQELSGQDGLIVKYADNDVNTPRYVTPPITGGPPSSNLYITGLPSPEVDQASLHQLFDSLDLHVVRSKVIPDTRGSGFSAAMVEVANQEQAERAISELTGRTLEGQDTILQVSFAAERTSGSSSARTATARESRITTPASVSAVDDDLSQPLVVKYSGNDQLPSDNLYINGLPSPQADQNALMQLFAGLGLNVVRSKVIPDTRQSGSSAAMVQLSSQEEAESAIVALHGQVVQGLSPYNVVPVIPAYSPTYSPRGNSAMSAPPERTTSGLPLVVKYAGPDGTLPSDNLYISGLPSPQVDHDELSQVFTSMGFTVVRTKPIPDNRGTGSSLAMVQLASESEAAAAIGLLNGQLWPSAADEEPVVEPHYSNNGSGGGPFLRVKYAGDGTTPSDNLYISGLPSPAPDQATVNCIFEELGLTVVRSKVIPDTKGTGISVALVQVASVEEAASAIIALDRQTFPVESVQAEVWEPEPVAASGRQWVEPEYEYGQQGYGSGGGLTMRLKYAGQDGTLPCDNLYITGLPSPAPDQGSLEQLFIERGLNVIRSRIIPDTRGSGSCAAMVQLASTEEATAAIELLQGEDFDTAVAAGTHRATRVPSYAKGGQDSGYRGQPMARQALPPPPLAPPVGTGLAMRVKYAGQGADPPPSDNLYISGLPSPAPDQAQLNDLFADLGLTVVRSKPIPDTRGTGSSCAMVQVSSMEEAEKAIESLDGREFPIMDSAVVDDRYYASDQAAGIRGQYSSINLGALRLKYAGDGSPSDNLYMTGLPSPAPSPEQVDQIFIDLGMSVVRSRVIPDTKGFGNSAAMVQLSSKEQAEDAMVALAPVGEANSWAAAPSPRPWERQASPSPYADYQEEAGDVVPGARRKEAVVGAVGAPKDKDRHLREKLEALRREASEMNPRKRGHEDSEFQDSENDWQGEWKARKRPARREEWKQDQGRDYWEAWEEAGGQSQRSFTPPRGAPSMPIGQAPPAQAPGRTSKAMNMRDQPLLVRYKGNGYEPSDSVYIRGLPSPQVEQAHLNQMFTDIGLTVVWSMVIPDTKGTGSSCGLVQLGSIAEATNAIEAWNGQWLT